jgi:stage V sporulation protein AC
MQTIPCNTIPIIFFRGDTMDKIEKQKQEQQYESYVKQKTPRHNVWGNMIKAFLTGGIICVLGQGIFNYCQLLGLSKDNCSSWTSLILILISVILTGIGVYPKIAKWGGAGALVPITGFANSVAAPAIEYKKEGQVFGIGCKIFTIAGPVILYGIFTSWALGFLYWLGSITGVA